MTDIEMYKHMQEYRLRWHRAKQAVVENDQVEATPHQAKVKLQLATKQWVRRLTPLDSVENAYQEIFHEREIAGYTGLVEAREEGILGDDFTENPLPVEDLIEIGEAAEEITVDVMDLPEQQPVDVEAWEPRSVDEIKAELEELHEELPAELDFDNNEF